MVDGYIICATPRSGSTLFCQYLASTGVAGVPESYFRKEDLHEYAEFWQILRPDRGYNFADYLAATRKAGSTDNGVLALRIMWSTLGEVTAHLLQLYPDVAGNELALLEEAFGRLKFIYLRRGDVAAQAISLYRAQQTGYWHIDEGQVPEQPPAFDFDAINSLVAELRRDNSDWQAWFQKVGVEPIPVVYEDFAADPNTTISKVLRFLEIEVPTDAKLSASNQRLADELTTLWLSRYSEELEKRNARSVLPTQRP